MLMLNNCALHLHDFLPFYLNKKDFSLIFLAETEGKKNYRAIGKLKC